MDCLLPIIGPPGLRAGPRLGSGKVGAVRDRAEETRNSRTPRAAGGSPAVSGDRRERDRRGHRGGPSGLGGTEIVDPGTVARTRSRPIGSLVGRPVEGRITAVEHPRATSRPEPGRRTSGVRQTSPHCPVRKFPHPAPRAGNPIWPTGIARHGRFALGREGTTATTQRARDENSQAVGCGFESCYRHHEFKELCRWCLPSQRLV